MSKPSPMQPTIENDDSANKQRVPMSISEVPNFIRFATNKSAGNNDSPLEKKLNEDLAVANVKQVIYRKPDVAKP